MFTYRSKPRFQQTYRLRTLHREITASGNHPFLTLRKVGRSAAPEPRFPERERQTYGEMVPRAGSTSVAPLRSRKRRKDYQPVDQDRIRDLYLAGSTVAEIAMTLGLSVYKVWTCLEEVGIPRRRRVSAPATEVRDLYLSGASLTEIAGVFGVSVATIQGRLKETGTPSRPVGGGTPGKPMHTVRDDWTLSWVNLEDLKRGDLIVTLKSLPDDALMPDDEWLSNPDYLWLLGAMFGDGHLGRDPRRSGACFLSMFGEQEQQARDVLSRLTAGKVTTCALGKNGGGGGGLYWNDRPLANALRRDGMGDYSTARQVTRALWGLPHRLIQAFLDGYTTADGHTINRKGRTDPGLSYSAANRGLIEDVRNLHMILGHNVTRVRKQEQSTKPKFIRGKQVKNAKPLWCFQAYEVGVKTERLASGLLVHQGIAELFPEDSHFAPQRVTSIEPAGTEDTYDITVEGTHNFIAQGLTVHNSGFSQAIYGHYGINAPRSSEAQSAWAKKISSPQSGGLAFYHSPPGGPDPGHVAIIQSATSAISQGGPGKGPNIMGLHAMPLLSMGIPPSGFGGAVGAGSPGKGNLIANASAIGPYLLAHGANKIAAAGIMGNMLQESGGAWNAPGGGLIQIIAGPQPTSLAQSLAQTIAYINANGGMGPINAAMNPAQATEIFMNQYERPAPATENLARRLAGAAAAYSAGYDSGGWLQPGTTLAVNNTGRPELVITGDQLDALSKAGPGGRAGGQLAGTINIMLPEGGTVADAFSELTFRLRAAQQQSWTGGNPYG